MQPTSVVGVTDHDQLYGNLMSHHIGIVDTSKKTKQKKIEQT